MGLLRGPCGVAFSFLLFFSVSSFGNRICSSGLLGHAQPSSGKTPFAGNVVFLGFGGVAQAVLPVLLDHVDVPTTRITVLDMNDQSVPMGPWRQKGVTFKQQQITPQNLNAVLSGYLKPGDLLIDLAWNIDTPTLLQWCHDHGVMYLNTSVEVWDPYDHSDKPTPQSRTLYARHMAIRHMTSRWTAKGPSAALEHGANPGLISHLTRVGLRDIGQAALREGKIATTLVPQVESSLADRNYRELARLLSEKPIHVSEIDTQESRRSRPNNEFWNTWSPAGFHEEGITGAEMGWGTHERSLPEGAHTHPCGPRNQICLEKAGIRTRVRTYVPFAGEITGMVVRHGEAFTLSEYLTVDKDGEPIYRPTVHYAYCPAPAARESLVELERRNLIMQPTSRIMNDDIFQGADILGALIMGHPFESWWTGSALSIEESRRVVPNQNATTVQVAASVVAATRWMIRNPMEGVFTPERIPEEDIMKFAAPYLGNVISAPIDWHPEKNRPNPSARADAGKWEFCRFLVSY